MVAAGTHSDRTEGGKMKAVRSHDTASTEYGNVNFKSISATGILPTRFFEGEKEQKTEPGLHG
jgi:hypothetical protein